MNRRQLNILSGLARGADRGSQNFINSMSAIQGLKQKKKMADTEFKLGEMKLTEYAQKAKASEQDYKIKAKQAAGFFAQADLRKEDEAYDIDFGSMDVKRVKEPKGDLDSELSKAVGGEISFDDVKKKYPTQAEKIQGIELQNKPVSKSPRFQEGKGLAALRSPDIAKLNYNTKRVVSNIKNEYDLRNFLDNADEYAKQGIDKKAVFEYFGIDESGERVGE